jgi:hypothetical protein
MDKEVLELLRRGPGGIAEWNDRRSWSTRESWLDFRRAWLPGIDLRGIDLRKANLEHAFLAGANLEGARLEAANLSWTFIPNANLAGANLVEATFRRTKLSGADLSHCLCGDTVFANLDLSGAKGLDSTIHFGPSTLGIDTLIQSRGHLPDAFLLGCGVPDSLINALPSLVNSMDAAQFYSVFISYSSRDSEFAERLHEALRAKGVRCWFAPHDLPIGAKIRSAIDESIRTYDKLLLVLSENSVNSQWVEQEVETALEQEREHPDKTVLFPVRLDDAVLGIKSGWPALVKKTRSIGDFRGWKDHDGFKKWFDRLLKDLKSEGPPAPSK